VIHLESASRFPDAPPVIELRNARFARRYLLHVALGPAWPSRRDRRTLRRALWRRRDPDRVIVTAGSSAALLTRHGADRQPRRGASFLADPGYPCTRHFVRVLEGAPVGIPVGRHRTISSRPELVDRHWTPDTRGVLIASAVQSDGYDNRA